MRHELSWSARIRTIVITVGFLICNPTQAVEEVTDPVGFIAPMSDEEETHVVESPAKGLAEFSLERDTMRLTWRVTFSGLTSRPIGAHIHGAERVGGNAPILYDLAPNSLVSPLRGSVTITDAQLAYFLAGRAYVNIHTEKYPDGEIRGQIQRIPSAPF